MVILRLLIRPNLMRHFHVKLTGHVTLYVMSTDKTDYPQNPARQPRPKTANLPGETRPTTESLQHRWGAPTLRDAEDSPWTDRLSLFRCSASPFGSIL